VCTKDLAAKGTLWKVTEKATILVFGKILELEMGDNKIITLSTKMTDEILWTLPSSQIWSKMPFNMQA
jgi:hypothetical protein